MHWILQEGFHSEHGWSALIETLERFELAHSVHAVIAKVGALTPEPSVTHKNIICVGSYSMRHVAAQNEWHPGVFDLIRQDFDQQKLHWGEYMLNFGSTVSTVREAQFSGERMFVRPTTDSKHFTGRVFSAEEFTAWRDSVCRPNPSHGTSLAPSTMIQISKPVTIFAEYRFWVVKGDVVTQSLYKRGNQVVYSSEVDERLLSFVKERIMEWAPHDTFVIDVCDSAQGMKIVEINTLNSSAFYAADVQRLVLTLENAYTD